MSVHKYTTGDGTRYEVRWRQGKRARSRAFASKKDANDFDVSVKARKLRGEAVPRSGRETLASVYEQFQRLRLHTDEYSPNTVAVYEAVWDAHIKGRHDQYTLAEVVADPQIIEHIKADMRERGVGNAAQRKVLVVLSALFREAVEWNKVGINPVLTARKPSGTLQRVPRPFPPLVVERIRFQVRGRKSKDAAKVRPRADACLVTLMAYAGLRPGEALALTWADVGARTLAIDKALSLGELASTKTRRARSVPLTSPLADDLADLRGAREAPTEDQLVITNRAGGTWSPSEYNNWRNRVWTPVMERLASSKKYPQPRLATAVPRDCRSTFVSLHLRAGASPLEVARWAGHSPKVMFDHYANVIDELVGEPRIPVEDEIIAARRTVATQRKEALDDLMAKILEDGKLRQLAAGEGSGDSPGAVVA